MHVPPGRNPNGLETIHDPKAKNGGIAPRTPQLVLVPLESISHYLSRESKNTPIACHM
jgi:hypothetical protein